MPTVLTISSYAIPPPAAPRCVARIRYGVTPIFDVDPPTNYNKVTPMPTYRIRRINPSISWPTITAIRNRKTARTYISVADPVPPQLTLIRAPTNVVKAHIYTQTPAAPIRKPVRPVISISIRTNTKVAPPYRPISTFLQLAVYSSNQHAVDRSPLTDPDAVQLACRHNYYD